MFEFRVEFASFSINDGNQCCANPSTFTIAYLQKNLKVFTLAPLEAFCNIANTDHGSIDLSVDRKAWFGVVNCRANTMLRHNHLSMQERKRVFVCAKQLPCNAFTTCLIILV